MECALKHFIGAAEQFINKQSDTITISNLQKQLEILIGLTSGNNASKFDVVSLQMTECISCLITILNDPDVNGYVAQKILTLFKNLLQGPSLNKELKTTFHLTSTLASFLFVHRDNVEDPAVLQCLEAMKITTYEIKIDYQEGYLDDLLPFLLHVIQCSPPHKLRMPCLIVFANLCRKNPIIRNWIQNMENKRSFYRCILDMITAIEQGDCMLTIAALSTFASVGINDETGIKLFQSSNIHRTFELIFNLLQKEPDVQGLAVDLMVDMLQNKGNQKNLLQHKYFNACITKMFALPLTTSHPQTVAKIYELIETLVSENNLRRVIIPLILKQYQNSSTGLEPLLVATHWYCQKFDSLWDTPIWAAKFLLLLKDFSSAELGKDLGQHIDALLPIIMADLSNIFQEPGINFEKACRKTVVSLNILENLCSHKNYAGKVASHLTVDICHQLIETMLENQNTADTSNLVDIMSETSVEVILYVLTLMKINKGSVDRMEDKLYQYLQDSRLMSVFALAFCSSLDKTVMMVLDVVHLGYLLPNFPIIRFVDCIKRWNKRHNSIPQNTFNANSRFNVAPVTNVCPQPPFPQEPTNGIKNGTFNSSMKNLIDKMESGLEIRDVMPSQVMEMYEHKIAALEVKERHLQGLLDAKAMSLQQADKLLGEYRCRWAQRDAEGLQLRSLLQEAERRSEVAKEETTKAIFSQQNVQKQLEDVIQDVALLDKQADNLKDANALLQANLNASSERMERIKAEHESAKKFIDVLQGQKDSYKHSEEALTDKVMQLESEAKSLMKRLKEKDLKLNNVTKELQNMKEKLREADEDITIKVEEISRLRDTIDVAKEESASLQREVAAMDSRCQQQQVQIEKAEAKIKKQKGELEKAYCDLEEHKKVAALICNLASNKSS